MIVIITLNILAEGITDALATPKKAISESQENQSSKSNKLDIDKIRKNEKKLNKSLEALKKAEMKRKDRLEPNFDAKPVLDVKDLCIKFERHGNVDVVQNVNFDVLEGQTMGLVGESGCGKSITSLSVIGLLGYGANVSGQIMYDGKNLLDLDEEEMQKLRGSEIAMIYQDALSSLNPSMLIKNQMKQLTSRGGTRSAEELLELVGLDPKRVLNSYPHELSGGQRQRVLIAMALTRDPKLIIADEPTTALDVTVQKQVIKLLRQLQEKLGFAMIFVSHDLALVSEVANYITVMYAGQIVEVGTVKDILTNPIHEYTRGLLGSVVSIESGGEELHQIPGTVPSPSDFPKGDRFRPRSSNPDIKSDVVPVLKQYKKTHHYYAELPDDELKKLKLVPYAQSGKDE